MEPRIVEGTGDGRRFGRAHQLPKELTLRGELLRQLKQAFLYMLFRRQIPLAVRQAIMFAILGFAKRLSPHFPILSGASKGNTFENDLVLLIFNATAIANIADNASSSPLTNLFVSLHTADPGETGTQTTSEISYTSYARATVARTSGGWTITANSVSPVASIDFPASTGGAGGTVTHFAIGVASSGASKILYSGTVTPNIVVSSGVTPKLTTATAITED